MRSRKPREYDELAEDHHREMGATAGMVPGVIVAGVGFFVTHLGLWPWALL